MVLLPRTRRAPLLIVVVVATTALSFATLSFIVHGFPLTRPILGKAMVEDASFSTCRRRTRTQMPTGYLPSSTTTSFGRRLHSTASSSASSSSASSSSASTNNNPPSVSPPSPEFERTVARLKKLAGPPPNVMDPLQNERDKLQREYLQLPANDLKEKLKDLGLIQKGRKPDLAQRLVQHDMERLYGNVGTTAATEAADLPLGSKGATAAKGGDDDNTKSKSSSSAGAAPAMVKKSFARMPISDLAAAVLASFPAPSPIQLAAMSHFLSTKGGGPTAKAAAASCILHAPTGSGKTIAYLLPVTEALVASRKYRSDDDNDDDDDDEWVAFCITPTRELAAQVTAVARSLAPPHTVHHVTHPMNLVKIDNDGDRVRFFIGSAKAIQQSLYGTAASAAPPTPKPAAMKLLQNTRYLILDEVDRLLLKQQKSPFAASSSSSSNNNNNNKNHQHERPAAILTAAVVRLSLGRATVLAASATAGRPVRRELARCMGLPAKEGPAIVRPHVLADHATTNSTATTATTNNDGLIQIPETITHYIVEGIRPNATSGILVTMAYGKVLRELEQHHAGERVLVVLSKSIGIATHDIVGALHHFGAKVVTEAFDDTKPTHNVLVTTEDSIRGMDYQVDHVVLVGRPVTPADYIHICGRTGRAGRPGRIITVGNHLMYQWEMILNIKFQPWRTTTPATTTKMATNGE